MGFLTKTLQDLSLGDLRALIRREVTSQVPPIPAGVALLADLDHPVVKPDAPADGEALYWNAASGDYSSSLLDSENLSPTIVLATEFIAGDPNGAHMELGVNPDNDADLGLRSFDANLDNTFKLDGEDGSVYMKGRLDWGTTSRLLQSDIMELAGQVASGVQVPARVQSTNLTYDGFTAGNISSPFNITWDAPTSPGSCLLMVVSQASAGPNTPTLPTITGWTQIQTATVTTTAGHMRQTLFKIENAATRSGVEAINLSGTTNTRYINVRMYEYSGVNTIDLTPAAATGGFGAVAGTATGILTQAGELIFGALSTSGDSTGVYTTLGSGGHSIASHLTGSPARSQTDLDTRVFELITTSTASVQITGSAQDNWIAQLVTFKASTATGAVTVPDAGHTRLYAQNNGAGTPLLHQADVAGGVGSLVTGPQGSGYKLDFAQATVSIPSTAGGATSSIAVSIAGLAVGDLAFWGGVTAGSAFTFYTDPVCASGGSITLRYHNTDDSVAHALASQTHSFFIVHRS